jgi:transposase-like protein
MKSEENQYIKRTQKDYSYAFKLQVVDEIERGELSPSQAKKKYGIQARATISNWLKNFGNFDRSYEVKTKKMKSPQQKLLELEQALKFEKRKNKSLEKQIERSEKKALFFDMMIDIAEEEFKISIRKKSLSNQSINTKQKIKKQ